jgi:ABC-2 type transport system ATP-binding protein
MITLSHVSKHYRQFVAVDDLSLEVRQGEILGLIGHNGAGKSTTLKMIAGLIAPTSGRVEIMGCDMARESTRLKRSIGYLPEESPLYENLTVREYLAFFGEIYRLPAAVAAGRAEALLEALQLHDRDKLTGELSKGMRRKVAIARALLHDPQLLILDEPNSGLDPLTSFFIINYLKELRAEGKTILLSAHNLFHVEYVCDRVAILKQGRLVICDSMAVLRKDLGSRAYEVTFHADTPLDLPQRDGNYVLASADVNEIAALLGRISAQGWALVDLAVRESALEEIYVQLMADEATPANAPAAAG